MSNNNTLYSERMKMAEIISADSNILPILERLGIELGFGEATVADICRRYELSTGLFLIICNIYSFADYNPRVESLSEKDIAHIMNYLRVSHKYYKELCFPTIHNSIHRLVEELDDVNRHLIDKFYDDYDCEVGNHFSFEENLVFPYIDSLINAVSTCNSEFSIVKFEKNHSNIGEKLNDLKNIIIKYLPENCSSKLRYDILRDICSVENDLRKHSLIENKLLVPLVENLEKSYES